MLREHDTWNKIYLITTDGVGLGGDDICRRARATLSEKNSRWVGSLLIHRYSSE